MDNETLKQAQEIIDNGIYGSDIQSLTQLVSQKRHHHGIGDVLTGLLIETIKQQDRIRELELWNRSLQIRIQKLEQPKATLWMQAKSILRRT